VSSSHIVAQPLVRRVLAAVFVVASVVVVPSLAVPEQASARAATDAVVLTQPTSSRQQVVCVRVVRGKRQVQRFARNCPKGWVRRTTSPATTAPATTTTLSPTTTIRTPVTTAAPTKTTLSPTTTAPTTTVRTGNYRGPHDHHTAAIGQFRCPRLGSRDSSSHQCRTSSQWARHIVGLPTLGDCGAGSHQPHVGGAVLCPQRSGNGFRNR